MDKPGKSPSGLPLRYVLEREWPHRAIPVPAPGAPKAEPQAAQRRSA